VHALRQIHKALAPGGILLDMHPTRPSARAEVGGVSLGDFDDEEFFEIVDATDRPLAESDLFELEQELEFDYLERWEDGEELLEDVEGWAGCRVPRDVAKRIREAEPPVDIWERVVLRRFRATPSVAGH
jgi:SAM-dependent methyltransferase